jgi:uncharacterized protein YkwD
MTRAPLLAFQLAALLPCVAFAQQRPDLPRTESLVIQGTNDFRRGERLGPVERNARLEAAAKAFAAHLAASGELSHEADGATPSKRARGHGYDFCLVSENIAHLYTSRGYETADLAKRLVEGWKKSPGHRKNMVEPDVIDSGVAVAQTAKQGVQHYYAVQMFGRPKSASVEFEIGNPTGEPVSYRVGERLFFLAPRTSRTHTECTAQELVIDLPEARDSKFTTRKGDKFIVAREKEQLSVRRQ